MGGVLGHCLTVGVSALGWCVVGGVVSRCGWCAGAGDWARTGVSRLLVLVGWVFGL